MGARPAKNVRWLQYSIHHGPNFFSFWPQQANRRRNWRIRLGEGRNLFSIRDDGHLRPVVYFFCRMNPVECNYEIYDKKLLTIINAFELWRSELEKPEKPVQVVTDHKNLEYFMSSKLLNRRQARWSNFLSKFNFEIIYRPCSMNNRADVFTRRSEDVFKEKDNRRQFQWQIMLKKNSSKFNSWF